MRDLWGSGRGVRATGLAVGGCLRSAQVLIVVRGHMARGRRSVVNLADALWLGRSCLGEATEDMDRGALPTGEGGHC